MSNTELAVSVGEDLGRLYGLKEETRLRLRDVALRLLNEGHFDSDTREILEDVVSTILELELPGGDE